MYFKPKPPPLRIARKTMGNLALLTFCVLVIWIEGWGVGGLLLLFFAAAEWLRSTLRRQSEDAVRRSEERLRISQRIANIGSWDWDVATGRLDCSEELCRILAIPFAVAPTTYQEFLAFLPPEASETVSTAVEDALTGEDSYAVEYNLTRPRGRDRVVFEVGEVFRDQDGIPLRVVSVVHDVTGRREAENALFFEKRYRGLIENLPQRIYLKDCNSVYLSCNSSFAKELGLEPEEVFGKTDFDLFAEPLAKKRQQDDERVMAAGTTEERDEQRERDGAWVSKALIPLKDDNGRVYGLLGVLTDITFRKLAEEQLRESEERFRNTFEQAAVGICHVALSGTLIRINRRFCDILGYTQDELLGSTLDATIHPEDLGAERENVARLLRREIGSFSIELRQLRKDGSVVWVNLTTSLVCGPGGEPKYLAGVIEDVTANREAQELRRERDMVQAASRAKSEFLANMGHEIRTPMNAVMGLSRLALKGETSGKQRNYLEKICSSSRTLLDIINDILDFSKIEAGKVELEKTELNLQEVLGNISDIHHLKAHEKGIDFKIRLAPELPKKLVGDPLRLTQVLNNLIGNAVKFTEKGEVMVVVKPADPGEGEVAVNFCVQDTGIGIAPEQIDKIFTPFTQADSSTTRRYGGTGLGLSISRQLVELMGGELMVESVPGSGSSFSFTVSFGLPAAVTTETAAAQGEELRSVKLLVVDRDEISRSALDDILQGMPMVREFVSTVPAALSALKEESRSGGPPFDVVVVDGATAGENGIERLCRSVWGRYGWQLPIVATVAPELLEKVQQQADEWGLSAVYPTPVRPSLMLDGLVRALSLPFCRWEPMLSQKGGGAGQAKGSGAPPLFDPARLAAEKGKLERLLARNSLDAKRQFQKFCKEIPPGLLTPELSALEACMEKLDFRKARQLLAIFPAEIPEPPSEERETL